MQLGAQIRDTCTWDTHAATQSLNFIKHNQNIKPNTKGQIFGVIGPVYSSVTIPVASILQVFDIPQISHGAAATELSDVYHYTMFARTFPAVNFEGVALADVAQKLEWTYVSAIASKGAYGEGGLKSFEAEAEKRGICIISKQIIPEDANEEFFDNAVHTLSRNEHAKAVLLFNAEYDNERLLKAVHRNNAGPFLWLSNTGWARNRKIVTGPQRTKAVGLITISSIHNKIPAYNEYMATRTFGNNGRNIWYKQYLRQSFNKRALDDSLSLVHLPNYKQQDLTENVINAVYAFAHGLHASCFSAENKSCPHFANYSGANFFNEYVRKVNFTGIAGTPINFDESGNIKPRYTLYHYRTSNSNKNGLDYVDVGTWEDGKLCLNITGLSWSHKHFADDAIVELLNSHY